MTKFSFMVESYSFKSDRLQETSKMMEIGCGSDRNADRVGVYSGDTSVSPMDVRASISQLIVLSTKCSD